MGIVGERYLYRCVYATWRALKKAVFVLFLYVEQQANVIVPNIKSTKHKKNLIRAVYDSTPRLVTARLPAWATPRLASKERFRRAASRN